MNAADSNSGLFGRMLVFLVPLGMLTGTAIYLQLFVADSGAGIFNPLITGAVIVLFIAAMFAFILWGSRGNSPDHGAQIGLILLSYVIAVGFALAALFSAHLVRVTAIPIFAAGFVALVAVTVWLSLRGTGRPAPGWYAGMFYYNPQDPSLWVDKRSGLGLTLNFAHPRSWFVAALSLLLPVIVLLGIAHFAVKIPPAVHH